jgi:predicted DsbA family dithiol-disulfide isomerase
VRRPSGIEYRAAWFHIEDMMRHQELTATRAGGAETSQPAALTVEFIGDLVCPFSFLGKRRLDEAVSYVHGPMTIGWYPYQINPDMPADGQSFDQYIEARFGSVNAIQPVLDRLRSEGRELGIDYRFDRLTRVPNTLGIHQFLQLAEDERADVMSMVDALMSAYLTEGENIDDRDVIVAIGEQHGLRSDVVIPALDDERSRKTVLAREKQIRDSGMSGVPAFLMNRRLLLVGAQEVSGIVEGFDRAMFGDADGQPVDAPLH